MKTEVISGTCGCLVMASCWWVKDHSWNQTRAEWTWAWARCWGRPLWENGLTRVWWARGEYSGRRKLRLEEGRRNSAWIQWRAVESRRAPWEKVDLLGGPGNQDNSSPAGVGTREGWATALVSSGHEECSVHCNLGIACGTQPARTWFPLRGWGLGGAWVAWGWILVYWEEKASLCVIIMEIHVWKKIPVVLHRKRIHNALPKVYEILQLYTLDSTLSFVRLDLQFKLAWTNKQKKGYIGSSNLEVYKREKSFFTIHRNWDLESQICILFGANNL